jgi:hypothetical protein
MDNLLSGMLAHTYYIELTQKLRNRVVSQTVGCVLESFRYIYFCERIRREDVRKAKILSELGVWGGGDGGVEYIFACFAQWEDFDRDFCKLKNAKKNSNTLKQPKGKTRVAHFLQSVEFSLIIKSRTKNCCAYFESQFGIPELYPKEI